MAIMIPDTIPKTATSGETTLYNILRDRLPDDFYVWYERRVNGRYPDFTILNASFGLLIIEVKDWSLEKIVTATHDYFEVKCWENGRKWTENRPHPLQQCRSYLINVLKKFKRFPILTHRDGTYKGQVKFPIGWGAVMSNITAEQAHQGNFYGLLEQPQAAYQEELLDWQSFSDRQLIERLKEMFTARFNFMALSEEQVVTIQDIFDPHSTTQSRIVKSTDEKQSEADGENSITKPTPNRIITLKKKSAIENESEIPTSILTYDQISTLKGILHPDTVIRSQPVTEISVSESAPLPNDSIILQTLDIQQEQFAKKLGKGHRLISGVAGSGKTLILLCRAKYLLESQPDSRILILCFNKPLAAYLRSVLHEDEKNPQHQKIEVFHFNAWAKQTMSKLPNPKQYSSDKEVYNEELGEQLLNWLANFTEEQRWDSILIDEAHTFSPSWFKCCVAALKDRIDGDLLIVSDGLQSLYQRGKFTWKSVGVKAQGQRSRKLTKNYRNTQEILDTAWSVVERSLPNLGEANNDEMTFPIVQPTAALRHGDIPVLHIALDRYQEIYSAVSLIKKLQGSGYDSKDIAIIYHNRGRDIQPLTTLIEQLDESGCGAYWVTETEETKERYSVNSPGVRIITALSSLGLEFKVVFILWLQQFANCHASNPEIAAEERRKLYVAMTRAQEKLYVFGSGHVPILNELKQSQYLTDDLNIEQFI